MSKIMCISTQLLRMLEKQSEPFGVKDDTSTFVYANKAYSDLLALPKTFNVIGKKDGELPAPTAEFQSEFQAHDRLVESTEQIKRSLEIHPFGKDRILQAYFFEKMPFYSESGDVCGTIFHGYKASKLHLDCEKIMNKSIVLTPPDSVFSKREWDIVFLLLNGKKPKEIAGILNISISGLRQRISGIFNKAGISSVAELIEISEYKKWGDYIPENFLPLGHYML